MPRQTATAIENNFKRGRITEATGLNYPENACTDELNCIFQLDGTVIRRSGYDAEYQYNTITVDRTNGAVTTTIWKNVGGNGDLTLFVLQIGRYIYFYNAGDISISSGYLTTVVDLVDFLSPDAVAATAYLSECQYATSSQHLIVTNPYCEPFYIEYDTTSATVAAHRIVLKTRDLEGDPADPYATASRPQESISSVNISHLYNLYNQGWSYENLTTWDTNRTDMPSNSDVMWTFKNAEETFSTDQVAKVIRGNSPAPRGHFILDLFDQNREIMVTVDPHAATGASLPSGRRSVGDGADTNKNTEVTQTSSLTQLTGTTNTNSGANRPATCAFYAGRIFYSGVNIAGYNSKIYFTQIIEKVDQYGFCYQINDPTAEDLFDLGPADGGFISIPEAGTIVKLMTVPNGLLAFANNGVWLVSGSVGSGFTATDYTVQRVSSVISVSASSFVDVGGYPAWMNADGVYIVSPEQGGAVSVKSLTLASIKTYMDTFPAVCKEGAKGHFNHNTGIIQWLIRSTAPASDETAWEFDTILNYNVSTGAWYTWSVPDTAASINGITLHYGSDYEFAAQTVVDGGVTVVDGGVTVTTNVWSEVPTNTLVFKYVTSVAVDSTHWLITFSEARNELYRDWMALVNPGSTYSSYFVSGYKVHGQGNKKFQPAYLTLVSKTEQATSYAFQASWDYANTSATHRYNTSQTITHSSTSYDYASKRIKVRGHGKALQFRVTSIDYTPFEIVGWVGWEMINAIP